MHRGTKEGHQVRRVLLQVHVEGVVQLPNRCRRRCVLLSMVAIAAPTMPRPLRGSGQAALAIHFVPVATGDGSVERRGELKDRYAGQVFLDQLALLACEPLPCFRGPRSIDSMRPSVD